MVDFVPYLREIKALGFPGSISLELEYSPEPDKIAEWVAEAYTATAAYTAEVAPVSASSTTTTESSSTAAVASRPRGRTQCKQGESNYANYSFCFHTRTLARAARRCYCASAGFCDVTCGMMRAPSFEIGYVRRVARLLKVH